MASYFTIARPYAKAVFEEALETNSLADWSTILHTLAGVMSDKKAISFIGNPKSTAEQQASFLKEFLGDSVAKKTHEAAEQLLTLLTHNKRLLVLPAISTLFESLREEQEKTLVVSVKSFAPLSEQQQQDLIKKLKHRLKREITLEIDIDTNILGGAIIRAGDLVIDGSVDRKLKNLRSTLVA